MILPRLLSLLLLTLACRLAAAPATQPNIIFILADDLGYGELSCQGQRRYETPNIDRLAAEGVRFIQAYAGSAICAPSRATLMTGRHTGHVSVRNNFGVRGGRTDLRIPLQPEETTVAEVLQGAGYRTAIIGKWGLGEEGSGQEPWNRGFNFFYGYVNQAHAHNQYPEFLYRNATKEAIVPNYSHKERVYSNDRFFEESLRWIGESAGRQHPFFLYLALTTPHADLKCPPDSVAAIKRLHPELAAPGVAPSSLNFAAMMYRTDRAVGRLMERLKELGIDDRTLVIFSSDNGAHQEDHKDNAYFTASGPLRGIKRDLYEGGIRVPFIARWPGTIGAGRISTHQLAFWDFLPTVAELAGAPVPPTAIDGISFVPELLGRPGQKQHEALYWELLIGKQGRQAVRAGDWKLVRQGQDAPWELYDLARDLGETTNVASRHPDVVRRLSAIASASHTESSWFPLRLPPAAKSAAN